MNLHLKHIELVEAVNNAKTELEHALAEHHLNGWRDGVNDCGRRVNLMDADLHYMDKGVDRPMCCGVFLDWKPT